MIEEVVSEGRMPPWSANPEFGHFANDARLSDAEKKLIRCWVDKRCPQGNPADLPAAKKMGRWLGHWRAATRCCGWKRPYKVPAEGVIPYQMFVVDPGWTEDKWIQKAEVLPSNRGVVHHIIAAIAPPGSRVFSAAKAARDAGDRGDRARRFAGARRRRNAGGMSRRWATILAAPS